MTAITLCSVCRQLFKDNIEECMFHCEAPEEFHRLMPFHEFRAFKASAASGCEICLLLLTNRQYLDSVDEDGEHLCDSLELHNTMLYSWVRKSRHLECAVSISYEHPKSVDKTGEPWDILGRVDIVGVEDEQHLRGTSLSSNSTSSEQTFGKLRNWLTNCNTHMNCQQWSKVNGFSRSLPTRLIKVGQLADFSDVCLLCEDSLPSIGDSRSSYATLSHCWGQISTIKLQKGNLDSFRSQIPWPSMSKIFQEAIIATRKLDIDYIWIDALCIIQDSMEDWLHEASSMQRVYVNSYINLSATASQDGRGGLFRERNAAGVRSVIVQTSSIHNKISLVCFVDDWNETVSNAPVNQRGWVVQERFLAPRVVHFSEGQVHWECMSLMTSEGLPDRFETSHNSWGRIKFRNLDLTTRSKREELHFEIFDVWDRLIERYTESQLTFLYDKPIAFSGISRAMQRCLDYKESDYIFGLWMPRLIDGLVWFAGGCSHGHQRKLIDTKAPSWSWLSIDGTVQSQHDPYRFLGIPSSISRTCSIEPVRESESDITSLSNHGHIRIRGPMCKAIFTISKEIEGQCYHHPEGFDYPLVAQVGEDTFVGNIPSPGKDFSLRLDDDSESGVEALLHQPVFLLLLRTVRPAQQSRVDKVSSNVLNGPSSDTTEQEMEALPYYGVGVYQFLILAPHANSQSRYTRIGYVEFGMFSYEVDDSFATKLLDKHLRDNNISGECYESMSDDFMYTITLV